MRHPSTARDLAWLAPSLAGVLAFFVLPAIAVVWMATQDWDLLALPRWAGLGNLAAALADPRLPQAVAVTAGIGALALGVQIAVGFALGQALAARPGGRALGAALLLPWATAPFAVGALARWIVAPSDGVLAGMLGHRVDLVADPVGAPLVVAVTVVWQGTGFAAVLYAGALRAVPPELRLAASLDGAGRWRIARAIDWPLTAPTTFFLTVTGTVTAFGLYDVVVPLTGGGPGRATETVTGLIVATAWGSADFGRAAAFALILTALQACAVGAQWAVHRRMRR